MSVDGEEFTLINYQKYILLRQEAEYYSQIVRDGVQGILSSRNDEIDETLRTAPWHPFPLPKHLAADPFVVMQRQQTRQRLIDEGNALATSLVQHKQHGSLDGQELLSRRGRGAGRGRGSRGPHGRGGRGRGTTETASQKRARIELTVPGLHEASLAKGTRTYF